MWTYWKIVLVTAACFPLTVCATGSLVAETGSRPVNHPDEGEEPTRVHFFVFVMDVGDIDGVSQSFSVNAYVRLRDEGIVPKSCINHGFTTSLYYADPDGNEVELAVDNFDDVDSMNAWFATGAFDRNFVGVPFDPEDMVKQHREGASMAKVMRENYE